MTRGRFSRLLLLLGTTMVLGYSGVAIAQGTSIEYGIDRPGADRYNFDLVRPEPTDCQAVCLLDQTCRAWTFVRPGFQGPHARCWLKSQAPAPQDNFCCVSGVKE
ncbi:MAG TPA: PAN domain-containing protein [Candidatus Tectomicrobia bacterium]|nr:PAN domain-containing protein [Candidatus Tectomicrobia bacterium]